MRAEIDDSNCIVIVEERINSEDVRITVTNVSDLVARLNYLLVIQAMNDLLPKAAT